MRAVWRETLFTDDAIVNVAHVARTSRFSRMYGMKKRVTIAWIDVDVGHSSVGECVDSES